MKYVKKGFIYKPDGKYYWNHSYACPVTSVEFDTFIRCYFTTRSGLDEKGYYRCYVTYLDCDKKDPSKILYIHDKPLLEVGPPGTFDEHGIMIADVIVHHGTYYMYYMGWERSDTVPYIISLGLATSSDGLNFTKVSLGPVIGPNRFAPFGVGNASIVVEDNTFHMWYTHFTPWIKSIKGYRPNYDLRYAYSSNGMDWQFGDVCIAPKYSNEAIAAPCVRKLNGRYHMWYSHREGIDAMGNSGAYRIGYAVSDNRTTWERLDSKISLDVSASGWDSEMIAAPDVIQTKENTFMFYCGNNYGRDGFGYAELFI